MNLVELRAGPRSESRGTERPIVVAWIEAGEPDLEFDGAHRAAAARQRVRRRAARRPKQDAVQISLDRKLAA